MKLGTVKYLTILMIDDDEDDCNSLGDAIQDAKFKSKFLCLHDGAELIAYLHRQGKYRDSKLYHRPDLILLDLNMPIMNGLEALKIVKSDPIFREIPVIILTTSSVNSDALSSCEAGADAYVTKPTDFESLTKLVQNLHNYWAKTVGIECGEAAVQSSSLTILMVDDDEDDCLLVGDSIQEAQLNWRFRCLPNGEELIDYLNRQAKYQDSTRYPEPDLILLDLNMPKLDGREALKIIKTSSNFRKIPVVILTTSDVESDILSSYDSGANSYIVKPTNYNDMDEFVQSLHKYWEETVCLPNSAC